MTSHVEAKGIGESNQELLDDLIQQTNSSSIVSKRSVEKLYYGDDPAYFRYFVSKFKRRSPLINRGYWLRMRAIEHTVQSFLEEDSVHQKVIINLGCGYDPLPWLFLGKRRHLCENAKFIDVDYPALMHKKVEVIKRTPALTDLLPAITFNSSKRGVLCDSSSYTAIGCDLRDLVDLRTFLSELHVDQSSIAILCVAEVSIAYMKLPASQAVLEFAASYSNVRFCLLEQHLPDGKEHPFAQTMLNHFEKLRTRLHSISTMESMKQRFVQAGWPEKSVDIRSLWHMWSDSAFLTDEQRRALDGVEPFDEWEEFALFCSHYFVLIARKGTGTDDAPMRASETYSPDLCSGPEVACEEMSSAPCQRRFAATFSQSTSPAADLHQSDDAKGLIGGLGQQGRLTDTATYTSSSKTSQLVGPPLRNGLMCHTSTDITPDLTILIGGRTSPDNASAACWLRNGNDWRQVDDLPQVRYRHSAIAFTQALAEPGVLVFGGRSSEGELMSDFLLWTESAGWNKVSSNMPMDARFGATFVHNASQTLEGILLGGIGEGRTVCQDIWCWRWDEQTSTIHLTRHEDSIYKDSKQLYRSPACRFGAQTFIFGGDKELMLVGGIGCNGLIPRDFELFNLTTMTAHPITGSRPLLSGISIDPKDGICFGGGATCFSFGTHWNKTAFRFCDSSQGERPPWHLCPESTSPRISSTILHERLAETTCPTAVTKVQVLKLLDAEHFQGLLDADTPAVLRGCDLGRCVALWTPEYLKNALGGRQIVVHRSSDTTMDFKTKNFRYETCSFSDFIDEASNGELLYMRALSSVAPAAKPTQLDVDFPQIAKDFRLPPELAFVDENAHSSPLRISGRTNMWLHYDVMANVLCQIHGSKRLLLYPPTDVEHVALDAGMSSSSIDVFSSTGDFLYHCHPFEAELHSGDILLIPALWLHAAAPLDGMSVAVNVFFRSLRDGYAAGKDVYGNRDLAAYERGRRNVAKIVKSMEGLSTSNRDFYLSQLALTLHPDHSRSALQIIHRHQGRDHITKSAWESSKQDIARIVRSFARLPEKERRFYLTRLAMEIDHSRPSYGAGDTNGSGSQH